MPLTPTDYEAIRNIYGRYSRAVDTGDMETFRTLFAIDATYSYDGGLPEEVGRSGSFNGVDEIVEMGAGVYADTQGHCMHWNLPLTIDGDGDIAHAFVYGMVLRRGQAPFSGVILTTTAQDTFIKKDGDWVFQTRVGHLDPLPKDMPLPTHDVLVTANDDLVAAVLDSARA
jgi:hypothetical protein